LVVFFSQLLVYKECSVLVIWVAWEAWAAWQA